VKPLGWAGVASLVLGVSLLLNFLATPINPSVTLGDLGVLGLLLGGLMVASDALGIGRTPLSGPWTRYSRLSGWLLFSCGLLIVLAAFLLENQVVCSPQAFGNCASGVASYGLALYAGAIVAVFGIVITVASRTSSRRPATDTVA
jgi:hypothetical protein